MDDNQKKLKIIQTIKDNNTRDLELLSDDIKKMIESSFEIRLNGTQNIRDQIEKDSNIPENNITLLHVAAYYDSLECFIFLQTKTNLNLRVESANGLFPLHYACWGGSSEVALYILSVDPDQAVLKSNIESEFNLLYCSTYGNKPEILNELFLKGCRLSSLNTTKQDIIFQKTILLHNRDILLLLYKESEKEKGSTQTLTPCERAVSNYNPEAFEILYNGGFETQMTISIISLICNVDKFKKKFKNILIKILQDSQATDIEPLIDENNPKEGICHWACKYQDMEITRLLFQAGNCKINRFNEKYETGPALLRDKKGAIVIQTLDFLIKKGFDVNVQHPKGVSLLQSFVLSINKNYDAIEFLISKGANINTKYIGKKQIRPNYTLYDLIKDGRDNRLKKLFGIHEM